MARTLEVYLRFAAPEKLRVGLLTLDGATTLFRYAPEYIHHGPSISPLLMPLSTQVYAGPERLADRDQDVFLGLPPVFSDSLPDRWGRGILDSALASRGITSPTALDYLGMLGHRAMGALTYEPSSEESDNDQLIEARALYDTAHRFVAGQAAEVVADLQKLGGSAGGMRPKLLIGYDPDTQRLWRGLHALPEGFKPALMKLPLDTAGGDASAYMRIEYAYHQMARVAGLTLPQAWLLEAHGQAYFIVERFDWYGGTQRAHMHSLGALIGRNFNRLDYDYDDLLRVVMQITRDRRQVADAFRQGVFNILAVNWDDHIKNFSFLMRPDGQWRLSPAYDVTYSTGRDGQPSTAVAGKKQGITDADLLALAKRHGIADSAPNIIGQVREAVAQFTKLAGEAGVPESYCEKIVRRQAGKN